MNIDELRAVAEAATPNVTGDMDAWIEAQRVYLHTFDSPTVLALIERVERAEAAQQRVGKLERALTACNGDNMLSDEDLEEYA